MCKGEKELMVPFYLSQLLEAFLPFFFFLPPMSVHRASGMLVEGDR